MVLAMVRDVIIVGAGIAGLTAALYTSRQKMSTLVISADLGGQLLIAPEIQNYPGFLSISGFDLIKKIEEQAKTYGTEIIFDQVTCIEKRDNHFIVKTISGGYEALSVILAFGKTPREMGIPGEQEFKGRGVSYCVICDTPLYRGKKVALVSWGHHGAENVALLKDYADKVYWIFPSDKPAIEEDILAEALSKGNVELLPRTVPHMVKGDKKVTSFVVKNKDTGEFKELEVDGVFVEIGYVTKTEFLRGFINLNDEGEIIIDDLCRTNQEGIFAAGDVTNMPYKQAIIAAGQGSIAALSAYNYVMRLKGKKHIVKADWKHIKGIKKEKSDKGLFLKI